MLKVNFCCDICGNTHYIKRTTDSDDWVLDCDNEDCEGSEILD